MAKHQNHKMENWRNRIKELRYIRAGDLVKDPRNWRRHPEAQARFLRAVLSDIGISDALLARETETGDVVLIDGHERQSLDPNAIWPVLILDVNEQEAAELMATLDPLAAMAETDGAALDALLREIQTGDADVQALLDELARSAGLYEEDEEDQAPSGNKAPDAFAAIADELSGAYMLKPDMRFPSDLPFGIPALLEDRLLALPDNLELWPGDDLRESVKDADAYLLIYSASCRTLDFTRTILAFYTDDRRFEVMWNYPDRMASKIINAGMLGCITPNFSLWPGQAQAVHIWQTYRSRWLGRYFQEAGISVIPDANWCEPADLDFTLAGIPVGAPCVSVQLQTFQPSDPEQVARVKTGLLAVTERLRPEKLLVYAGRAGRELVAEVLPDYPKVVLPTLMDYRRGKLDRRNRDGSL